MLPGYLLSSNVSPIFNFTFSTRINYIVLFNIDKFKDFEEVGTVVLGEDDVVRNPLIKKIEQIFRESKNK